MAEHKKGAVAYYLIIALILGAITYVEFAIVEYQNAISWLNPFWTIIVLVVLSLVKFALVVAIYMHLRDDDPIYTGFFSSGMVIAMGTFVALSFLFTVRSVNAFRSHQETTAAIEGEAAPGHGEGEHVVVTEPVKTLAESSHVPSPKNQAALNVSLPAAPVAEYSLRLPGLAMAETLPQNAETT
ncbi:MAG: cytochrome C oxidase subunit IV family protein, partial [Trueperaceae bacterium]|nr:cytochrome C oxidase subunit IV family protein [Trueperaceae bacterium]